jgi:ferrochelatase
VIEYPRWLWWPILNGIILNVRPRKSAKLYQSIWTTGGSPLLVYSQSIADQLQGILDQEFTEEIVVSLAMRYGKPAVKEALQALKKANAQKIIILPLFPQYSATTTATIFDVVFDELKNWRWMPELRLVNTYHDHPLYINGLAESIQQHWATNGRSAKLLLSFHGVPQRYIRNGDPYKEYCAQTAALVAARLNLQKEDYQVCFQSRFGPEPWLQPYTDKTLESWAASGLPSVDTICPGFAVDCLETLEEMAVENKEIFLGSGGQSYQYIPCMNDSAAQLTLMFSLVKQQVAGWVCREEQA